MEKDNNNDSGNLTLVMPNILEDIDNISSPIKSFIGDFTDNNLVYNGEEILEVKKSGLDNNSYLKSVLDLYQTLNNKIDLYLNLKLSKDLILEECFKNLLVGDSKTALELLALNLKSNLTESFVFKHFLKNIWPGFVLNVKSKMIEIKEKIIECKTLFDTSSEKLIKRAEECERLKIIINNQNKDHLQQLDSLLNEKHHAKESLTKIVRKFSNKDTLESEIFQDIISEVEGIVETSTSKVKELENIDFQNKTIIRDLKLKLSELNSEPLISQIEDQKILIKRLQDENVNFSDAIQKLSEKNIKLKQEVSVLESQQKKVLETIKFKNEAIFRQKALIEMFQNKLSGPSGFPIAELKTKKQELEAKIEIEKDFLKKQALKKEKMDYEKRLSDFLNLNTKNRQ